MGRLVAMATEEVAAGASRSQGMILYSYISRMPLHKILLKDFCDVNDPLGDFFIFIQ